MGEMDEHLASHNLTRKHEDIRVSPMLELDSDTEQFVGPGSKNANQYLNREYRKGYEVPNLA
ncbi:gfo/Idh/MocA family oxidoreductase, partial [Rhodopirellula sp.]|nr:gfo/Idh/MocA family oxidoreductase [Rhodopirellula sp.]